MPDPKPNSDTDSLVNHWPPNSLPVRILACWPIALWLAFLFLSSATNLAEAQEFEDIVITRKAGSDKTVKRRGRIVAWKGMSLTIHSTNRDREIDNDEIVELQTKWNGFYLSGLQELRAGRTRIAIEKLNQALSEEKRPWAKRIIRSKLVDAHQLIDQPEAAVKHFLEILREDPQSRFLNLTPLPWAGSGNSLVQQSEKWLASRDPATQLIGASWALAGPNRDKAQKVLLSLSNDIDARIRSIAIGQLWRTRANVSEKQTEVWQGLASKMNREYRAGPTFVLAKAQAQCQKTDEALINFMRIPILYPNQRYLCAAALYRAANLLHNSGKSEQGRSLLNELISKYPESIWAQQATNK